MVNFTCPIDRQPDVMWMGGVSEFVKVVALASACGVPVVPHGCGVYGYYMAMAFGHITLAEFMMMGEQADTIEPNFGTLFRNEPLPEGGYISLSDSPGFGLELNKEKLNLVRPFARESARETAVRARRVRRRGEQEHRSADADELPRLRGAPDAARG